MFTESTQATGMEGALTIVLAGTVAALVVQAARGSHHSPLRGLLSNPVPRLASGKPGASATRRTLDRAA
jgi:hypothetical protein